MPRAWRIVKAKHALDAFSGEGARRFGGRWNRRGTPMVYTAGSASLAALEMLVHLQSQQILDHYVLITVEFDERLVTEVRPAVLPSGWRETSAPASLSDIGDQWIVEGNSAVLRVPSALIETEFNYLLNPMHPDFALVSIGKPVPFAFDPRLVKQRP